MRSADVGELLIAVEGLIVAAVLELPHHPDLPHLAGAHDALTAVYNRLEAAELKRAAK